MKLRKQLAAALSLTMIASLAACSSGGTTNTTAAPQTTAAAATTAATTAASQTTAAAETTVAAAPEYPDYVTAPITIEFWHTMGSGSNLEAVTEEVETFNATNPYGITVEATYQGGYADVLSKVKTAYSTGSGPAIAVVGAGGIEELANAGVLMDVADYVARDNYDLENIPETLRLYMQHYEGKVIEFPWLVSSAVIYYNKAFFDKEPESIEEWVEIAKKITAENPGVYGMGLVLDTGMYKSILQSLGANAMTEGEEGDAPALLDDGSLERFMTDWSTWIQEGYCAPLNVTDSQNVMKQQFFSGNLAAMATSSGGMGNMEKSCKEAGIEMGVARMVGYGGYCGPIGGGGVAIMTSDDQQKVAAAWEFIKFLMEDEQQALVAIKTGYLPFSYSAAESQTMQDFWADNPHYKVAYDQLDICTYQDWSIYLEEWRDQVTNCITNVIIDGSMTPAEAIDYLRKQAAIIFP